CAHAGDRGRLVPQSAARQAAEERRPARRPGGRSPVSANAITLAASGVDRVTPEQPATAGSISRSGWPPLSRSGRPPLDRLETAVPGVNRLSSIIWPLCSAWSTREPAQPNGAPALPGSARPRYHARMRLAPFVASALLAGACHPPVSAEHATPTT